MNEKELEDKIIQVAYIAKKMILKEFEKSNGKIDNADIFFGRELIEFHTHVVLTLFEDLIVLFNEMRSDKPIHATEKFFLDYLKDFLNDYRDKANG